MIAAMFTVTWIQRHNELTAPMAAGISRVWVIKARGPGLRISIAVLTRRQGARPIIPRI